MMGSLVAGYSLIFQVSNLLRSCDSIHHRHLDVHEHRVIALLGVGHLLHGDWAEFVNDF